MMTAEKKIKSLIITIALLIITNIVLLLFLVFSKNDTHSSHQRDTRSVIETFLEDKIGFDKQQMVLYKNIREADFEKRAPIFDTLQSAKNAFYEIIYTDSIPDSVINTLTAVINKRQMAVDNHMLQYFKDVRRICTAEQLPKFDSSFKAVVEKITAVRFRSKKRGQRH